MDIQNQKNPPHLRARDSFLVEPSGIEPLTSTLPVLRSGPTQHRGGKYQSMLNSSSLDEALRSSQIRYR